jgi:multimeric flavodoxin WrbA
MNALGIAFSARRKGNCLDCVEYVLTKLRDNGFETSIVNAYEYSITSCSHYNYECFASRLRGADEKCPIRDDAPRSSPK